MYERCTDRMRNAMQMASREAKRLDEPEVNAEHVLMGILLADPGVAIAVLKNLQVMVSIMKREIEQLMPTVPPLPLSLYTQKTLDAAKEESRSLGHNYVGTEHVLLGLLRGNEGIASEVLAKSGVNLEAARAEVLKLLSRGLD